MKIGLVVYGKLTQISGGYRYDRKLVDSLRDQGTQVDVIELTQRSSVDSTTPQAIREKLNRSVDVLLQDGLCYPTLSLHNHRLDAPGATVALMHHLRSLDPTDPMAPAAQLLERRYLQSVDGIISTSRTLDEQIAALAPSARPRLVAYPGGRVEGAALTPEEVSARASETPLRVCFLGTVGPRKDPRTVVTAAAKSTAPVELTIVGGKARNPTYGAELEHHIKAVGIDDCVRVLGTVSDSRLRTILARSHVCAVPSRYEVFGMALLEAMEYGVVPIATTAGGPGEFITDGEDGFLVDPGDPDAVASRFDALADNERLERMGTAALATAQNHQSWTETAEQIRSFCRNQV